MSAPPDILLVEDSRTQDLHERGINDQIRCPGPELRHRIWNTQFLGLDDRESKLKRSLLDRWRDQCPPASGLPVRLGDHANDGIIFRQGAQAGHGKIGRPHENHTNIHDMIVLPFLFWMMSPAYPPANTLALIFTNHKSVDFCLFWL